jgi:hypothetical protein
MKPSDPLIGPGNGPTVDRREFLAAAGGVVVAALTACDAGTAPGEGGTVVITVTGLRGNAGGSVVVTHPASGSDAGITIAMPAPDSSGESVGTAINVPEGVFRIQYLPPSNHDHILPSDSIIVQVVRGVTSTGQFALQATGALEVRISGLAIGAQSAGTITVTDAGGGAGPLNLLLSPPVDGESIGLVSRHPIGNFSVRHNEPSGHSHVGTDTRQVSISFADVSAATFQLLADAVPPPQAGLVFASDWSTATGRSDAAWRDTNKARPWSTTGLPLESRNGDVVASTGLDFPTANVFRVGFDSALGGRVTISGAWPAPNVGDVIYYRTYFRNALPPTGLFMHPLFPQVGGGTFIWEHMFNSDASAYGGTSNQFRFDIRTLYDGSNSLPEDAHHWNVILDKNVTYRIEWRLQRMSAEGFRLDARVFNDLVSLAVPAFDSGDFTCGRFGHSHSLADTGVGAAGAGANIRIPASLVAALNELNISDPGTYSLSPTDYCYWGAVAVSLTDWCGPYVPGEGPTS